MTVGTGSILRIVAQFDLDGESKAQNVYHAVHLTATPQDEDDVVDACEELLDLLMVNFNSVIHTSVALETVTVYERVSGAWDPIGSKAGTWAGNASSPRLASGLALMVKLFKARTGHVDRKFFAGFTEGGVSGDTWGTSELSSAANFVLDMLPTFVASNSVQIRPQHFNRADGTTKDYIGGAGDPRVSYQRRRKPGVGLS